MELWPNGLNNLGSLRLTGLQMKLSFQSDAVAVDVADVAVAVAVAVAQSEQVQGIIATSNIGSTRV